MSAILLCKIPAICRSWGWFNAYGFSPRIRRHWAVRLLLRRLVQAHIWAPPGTLEAEGEDKSDTSEERRLSLSSLAELAAEHYRWCLEFGVAAAPEMFLCAPSN